MVNIGPQHPSTHGVLHFRVSLDGEIIKKIDPVLGYIHRGVEKLCESLNYPQTLHFMDRLDYFSAHNYHHGLCLCIEKAAGIEDGRRPGLTDADRTELREAKKQIRLLEQENEVLRRAAAYLSQANLPGK